MRIVAALAVAVLVCAQQVLPARGAAVDVLLLGDRTCSDTATDCVFPAVLAAHRYLHIVVHDVPHNSDWQVQAGPTCTGVMSTIGGGEATDAGGWIESVIALDTVTPPLAFGTDCYILRGRNHWAVTYYAAYFDDNPAPDAAALYPHFRSVDGKPDLPDLDVAYISRAPAYAYDASPGWPALHATVTFTAHVRNAGVEPANPFAYQWSIDGAALSTGYESQPIAAGQETTISFPWHWRTGPHNVQFTVLPGYNEVSPANDTLTVRTDALSLGFWIEQSAFDYFQRFQWQYCRSLPCSGSDSFADWLQRQVQSWNLLLSSADYPGIAPTGIADRIAVSEIHVVPDGSLPLHGKQATNQPDVTDHAVDLEWGMPAANVAHVYPHHWQGPFDVDWALIHELSHARSLADLYRFDIPAIAANHIDVTDAAGAAVVDALNPTSTVAKLPAFPAERGNLMLYQNEERDLMSCVCTPFYSAYDAVVLNRLRGQRARCGNYNPPCSLGEWFLDIPPRNILRVLDAAGRPVPDGSRVNVFYDGGTTYTNHQFDSAHSAALGISGGTVDLGADPFHTGGNRSLAGHNLLLLEVRAGAADTFCFVEPTVFNMAYWQGYRDAAHPASFTLRLGNQRENDCGLAGPAALVNEPFDVSPTASHLSLSTRPGRHGIVRRLLVQLLDDATPPHPMRNRQVVVTTAGGRAVRHGLTNTRGRLQLSLPAFTGPLQLYDATDNLTIGQVASAQPGPSDPQP